MRGKPDEGEEGRIVFSSARDGDFDIYVMDGDGVEQLTRNESSGRKESDDHAPAWSPDGSTIAFTSTRDHDGDRFDSNELYVMEASGANQTRLTENELGAGSPRWSPDGESIVLIRRSEPDSDRFEVAVGSRDGTGLDTLLENGELVLSVDWSPDGTMIALTSCAEPSATARSGSPAPTGARPVRSPAREVAAPIQNGRRTARGSPS